MPLPASSIVEQLAAPAGRALLDSLPRYADLDPLAVTDRLRAAGQPPDLVAAVLAQARLRERAVAKFGPAAATLLYTADGLEQATRPELADRHAARYAAAGLTHVHDLGCGIGSDALALARAGLTVRAVEADRHTAAIAAANLADHPKASVVEGDATSTALPGAAGARHTGVWVDPGRRGVARDVDGRARRIWSLDQLSPSWADVQRFAASVPATGAKLSPAFPHAAVPAGCEAQWSSWRGELLECVVWWGPLVCSPGRTAAVCRPGPPAGGGPEDTEHPRHTEGAGTPVVAVVTEADVRPGPVLGSLEHLHAWLWEADPAVLRAGLAGALPGAALGPAGGYSTGADPVDLSWARRFAVIDAMPLREKTIRAWLRRRGIGRVTVKKRGTSVDATRLTRALAGPGSGTATLVVTTVAGRAAALVVEPT